MLQHRYLQELAAQHQHPHSSPSPPPLPPQQLRTTSRPTSTAFDERKCDEGSPNQPPAPSQPKALVTTLSSPASTASQPVPETNNEAPPKKKKKKSDGFEGNARIAGNGIRDVGLGVGKIFTGLFGVLQGSAGYVVEIGTTCVGSTAGWVDGIISGIEQPDPAPTTNSNSTSTPGEQ